MSTLSPQERFGDGDDLETAVDPVDERLVAYLDGELAGDERATLEQRLVDEAGLRRRLQELQGGWEMLDELPQVSLQENFTQTTLEMVASRTLEELERRSAKDRLRSLIRPLLILLVTLASMGIGALFVRVSRRAELQRQLNELPIVEHLDGYLLVDDLDWLRSLADDPRWLETINAAEAADVFGPTGLPPAESALKQAAGTARAEVIARLPAVTRERLQADWKRWQQLEPERRHAVRMIAQEVASDPRSVDLLRTIDAYARWRETLPPQLQDGLASEQPQRRQEALEAGIEYSQQQWRRESGRQLAEEDAEAIYAVMRTVAQGWIEQLDSWQEVPGTERFLTRVDELSHSYAEEGFEDFEAALLDLIFVRLPRIRGVIGERNLPQPEVGRLSADDIYLLEAVLSDATRETLLALAPTFDLQEETLSRWVRESVERKTGRAGDQEQVTRLEKLQALDREERLEVELSPPDELFWKLERAYQRDRWGGWRWPRRGRPGGEGFRQGPSRRRPPGPPPTGNPPPGNPPPPASN